MFFLITIILVIGLPESFEIKGYFYYIPITHWMMPDLPWYPWCSNLSFIYNQYMMLDNNYFRHIHVRACLWRQFWQVNIKLCASLLEVTTVPMCLQLSRLQIGSLLYCYALFIMQLHRASKFQVWFFFILQLFVFQ